MAKSGCRFFLFGHHMIKNRMSIQDSSAPASGDFLPHEPRPAFDLLELFWRRRNYVFVCVAIGVLLGTLYCGLATTMYESTADVLVVHKRPEAVTGANQYESGFEDYLETHLAIIGSPLIVERAIQDAGLASLDCFADLEIEDEQDLVDTIVGNLEVEGGSRDLGDSADSIMTLAFRCSVPEDCPVVVQALLDSYESFHTEVYQGMSENILDLIEEALRIVKTDLGQQEEEYNRFRQASPLVARGTDEVNPLQDRLTSIEVQRSELLLRRAEIERQLMALEKASEDGMDYQQLLSMVSELRQLASSENGLPTISNSLEDQLIQLVDDEQRLLEHYGPQHPHVEMVRQRIASTRRLFALPTSAHLEQREASDSAQPAAALTDVVAVYRQYLEQEMERLEISEKLLGELYDRQHEAARQHSIFQLKDERYRRSIERSEALYDVVVSRLQEASLIKGFGGFETRVIAPPQEGTKVAPSRRIILPVSAFAGMLLGCMLALLVELRDGSFHSSDQIRQQLGWPVLGDIPRYAAAPRSVRKRASDRACHPMLCCYYQTQSWPAESFRRLRTELFLIPDQSSRVVHVTGAGDGDGASTVAANLAISLAQSGKQVLLIDADLRQPVQARNFNVPAQPGLTDILRSNLEPADVICQTPVTNLSLLPAGTLPDGSLELFASPRLGELISMLRETWDHVLIDSESVVLSSDACVIASLADGVLLTLTSTRDSRHRGQQARQTLDRLDANILGVVVNQMEGVAPRRAPARRAPARTRSQRPSANGTSAARRPARPVVE
jgi:capsular exopolysaccharide synthesis family protein